MKMGMLLAGGWVTLFAASIGQQAVPTSYWFEPGVMTIENTKAGECPELHFDRIIRRPFSGEWIVTLRKKSENYEGYEFYKLYPDDPPGHGDYRPDAVLPEPLTFEWWTGEETCDWAPGTYQLLTQWKLDVGADRFVRIESNPFVVE